MNSLLAPQPILFASGCIGLAGSILLLRSSAYGTRRRFKAVPAAWLAAAVIQALASFGHALRADLPPVVVLSAVNATQILALSLVLVGARAMAGRAALAWLAFVPALIWLAACAAPGFMETRSLRLSAFVVLAYCPGIWATFELLRVHRRRKVRAALDMAVLVGVVMATMLAVVLQAILAPLVPDGAQAIFSTVPALFSGVPALFTALYGTTLPFLMLAVTREWDALEEGARNEASLRAGRAQVERLHARLPAIIFLRVIEPDGTSRNVYRGGDVEAVLGWPPEAVEGRDSFEDLMHPNDLTLTELSPRLLREGEVVNDWRLRQPDGRWRTMQTQAMVLSRRPDGSAEVVGYAVDMSARRAAEARALASARLASLGEMAAGMAHELKQPLQSISIAAEMAAMAVQRGDIGAVEARLDRIVAQTHRTARLIDHLRRFARGVDDGTPLEATSLDVPVADAVELCRGNFADAGIGIEVALGDPAPVVMGQAVLLEQVLTNLLLNARDALADCPAGAPRRIRISAAEGPEGSVTLEVSDTGGGIAPDIVPRLFEPFVTTKGPDKGTGLGLSICHGLIKGMGGTIAGANGPQGAIFTITLPAAPAGALPQGASPAPA